MLAGRTTQFPDVENAKIAIPIPDDIDALLTADPAVRVAMALDVRNAT